MKKYPHGLTLNAVCAAIEDYQRHEDSVPEEGILAAFNTLLGHSDIAEALRSMERTADANMAAAQAMRDDMYHWKQRAEEAEAKLAELEKQRPVEYRVVDSDGDVTARRDTLAEAQETVDRWSNDWMVQPVFTRPASAINLAEMVPEERSYAHYIDSSTFMTMDEALRMATEWNACRAAILSNIEEKG